MGDKSAFVGGMKLKISELGKVITGNTPSKKIKEFWDKDDVGFVKPDIISDEHIVKIKNEDCNEFISNAAISKARIVPKNSIFVTCIGNIVKIGVATENLAFNQQINAIIPNENVNLDYLCYAIFANKTRLQDIANAPIVPLLNKSQFSEFELEFDMDINTQTRIVNELNTVSNIILKYKQELLLLDELVRARFVEMFGDPNIEFKYSSVKFNDLVARMTKGPFGSDMKKDLFVPKGEDTYKVYIQINAIQKNQSLGEYYISKEYFDRKVSRFELFPNDYIITCDGTLGKYLKLDENMEKGVISPSLLRLTLQNDKINDKYFENIWDFYMLVLMKKEARNACLVHLPSAKKIGEISIPVPPLELQNQFASFVEEVDKSRSRIQKSLEASQELFDSLMQEYFG